jgi:hypothetical protein
MDVTINGRVPHSDVVDVLHFIDWLSVFASPKIYEAMGRRPTREHILGLLDTYVAYAQSDRYYLSSPARTPPNFKRRAELAMRLRELFASWSPPDVPAEIVQTTRGLLLSEGASEPEVGWDNFKADPDFPPEQVLRWPEGIPALLSQERSSTRSP